MRIKDADVILISKIPVNETTLCGASNLKLVCVTATGTNNLDNDLLEKRRIAWRNVAGRFGSKVIYYSASGAPAQEGYNQVDFDTLLADSDILPVHAPLNKHTENRGKTDTGIYGKQIAHEKHPQ